MMISDRSSGANAKTGSNGSNGHLEEVINSMNPPFLASSRDED